MSKKTGDYHEKIYLNVFHKWFQTQLLNLNPISATVTDKVPYLSSRINIDYSQMEHIMSWLEQHGVNIDTSLTKGALLG